MCLCFYVYLQSVVHCHYATKLLYIPCVKVTEVFSVLFIVKQRRCLYTRRTILSCVRYHKIIFVVQFELVILRFYLLEKYKFIQSHVTVRKSKPCVFTFICSNIPNKFRRLSQSVSFTCALCYSVSVY